MKPKAKVNLYREREALEEIKEQFQALTDLSKFARSTEIDELDGFVIDQWQNEGGK